MEDEEPKKSHKLPSMLEISEMFDKVQNRINSLSYNFEKSNSLLGIASQYEHLNSAASIADMASKAAQPVDFASVNVVDHSVIAMNAQLRAPEAIAVQDTFLEMTKGMSAYNNSLMSVKERMIQSIGVTSVYEDMMASANLVRKSIEPYRSAFDAVRTSFEASESFKIARELQSQDFLLNSLSAEYLTVFEQLESLRNLESFKAISRLKNFPNDKIWTQDYDKGYEVTEDFLAEVKTIDARISDEISSVDDFNELSESSKNSLEKLNLSYYQIFIIYYIYCITILREQISNSLEYSDMEFKFVGWSSKILVGVCFIGFQPDFNSICNSIVATILLDNIKQDGKK
ncbi:hypothetical protein [Psychrobacter alimentarius]|uniref:hypothetical protein n=1 Tax=Psychrobacter alimentarius TaxID=261164 RepID=UPI001919E520|nr:hypothetical protein [Psychrobacter alimentarius]